MPTRMPAGWDAPLSRVLAPRGTRLSTWREAGRYLSDGFSTVTRSAVLEHAIVLLMVAAESGKAKDRAAATEQVERVLAGRGLL
jgi:hypothetical protein